MRSTTDGKHFCFDKGNVLDWQLKTNRADSDYLMVRVNKNFCELQRNQHNYFITSKQSKINFFVRKALNIYIYIYIYIYIIGFS